MGGGRERLEGSLIVLGSECHFILRETEQSRHSHLLCRGGSRSLGPQPLQAAGGRPRPTYRCSATQDRSSEGPVELAFRRTQVEQALWHIPAQTCPCARPHARKHTHSHACIYVCIHFVHTHMHLYAHSLHTHTCIYMHTLTHRQTHAYISAHTHVHAHSHACPLIYVSLHGVRAHSHTCTLIHEYAHTHVCTHIYMHTFTCVHTHALIRASLCTLMCVHTLTHIYMHTLTLVHTHMHTHSCISMCTLMCMNTHALIHASLCTHTHIHAYLCAHSHACTHTHTHAHLLSCAYAPATHTLMPSRPHSSSPSHTGHTPQSNGHMNLPFILLQDTIGLKRRCEQQRKEHRYINGQTAFLRV